jgi:CDP-paratose 2-epimerase
MQYQSVLITGGAGFVGSSIALYLKEKYPSLQIVCLDNLSRRGSELQVSRLRQAGIEFKHGDVRNPGDLAEIDAEVVLECSAEPSVAAGLSGSPRYLIDTNLMGTVNVLEWARTRKAGILFLSTSRVYPIERLLTLQTKESDSRIVLLEKELHEKGISLDFSLRGARSLYGTTKLSSEYLVEEYARAYELPSVITRFGVITGPWQMGKVDQGFVSLFSGRYLTKGALSFTGFGGTGKQVRGILDILDVAHLIEAQLKSLPHCQAVLCQADGGLEGSVSLLELTRICETISGNKISIESVKNSHCNDVPVLYLDSSSAFDTFQWKPSLPIEKTVERIFNWQLEQKDVLTSLGIL